MEESILATGYQVNSELRTSEILKSKISSDLTGIGMNYVVLNH